MLLCGQMTVFTMYRDRIFRFDQGIDQFDFFLAGMSGNMDILEDNLCTLHGKFVDNLGYCLLISRDRVGTENDRIIWLDRDLSCGYWLPYGTRAAMDSPWLPVVIRTTLSSG